MRIPGGVNMRDYWGGFWCGVCVGIGACAMLFVIWDSLWAK